jgi:hypothetical protein
MNREREGEMVRQAWERGRPASMERKRRSPSSVLSIRVPDHLMDALSSRALEEGKPTGMLARELLEGTLQENTPVTPRGLVSMVRKAVEEMEASRVEWELEMSPGLSRSLWVDTYAATAETTRSPMLHSIIGKLIDSSSQPFVDTESPPLSE